MAKLNKDTTIPCSVTKLNNQVSWLTINKLNHTQTGGNFE